MRPAAPARNVPLHTVATRSAPAAAWRIQATRASSRVASITPPPPTSSSVPIPVVAPRPAASSPRPLSVVTVPGSRATTSSSYRSSVGRPRFAPAKTSWGPIASRGWKPGKVTMTTRCTPAACLPAPLASMPLSPPFMPSGRPAARIRVSAVSGRWRIAVVLAAALFLAACGGTSQDEFEAEIQSRGGGLGGDLAIEALDALETELGDDVALRSLTMSVGQVGMQVLVPGTDDQLDNYQYGSSGL